MEWESTLDSSTIVEWLSKDTLVTYQVSIDPDPRMFCRILGSISRNQLFSNWTGFNRSAFGGSGVRHFACSFQVHKRVWPATQRDSLFWSTIRHIPGENEDSPDYWCVINHSTEHHDVPVSHQFVVVLHFKML